MLIRLGLNPSLLGLGLGLRLGLGLGVRVILIFEIPY